MENEEKQQRYDVKIPRSDMASTLWIKGCTSIPDAITAYVAEMKVSGNSRASFGTGQVFTRWPCALVGWITTSGVFAPAFGVTMSDHGLHATKLRYFDTPQEALASMIEDITLFMEETTERIVREESVHYTEDDFLNHADKRFDYALIKDLIGFVERPEPQAPSADAPGGDITVKISPEEAERLSYGLSDLLCWAAGFRAALKDDDLHRDLMGVEAVRDMNRRLKRALDDAEKKGAA